MEFGDGTGTLVFNHTATETDSLYFSPAISGKGSIEVASGYTLLSADNSGFSGTITVDGGSLTVAGHLKGEDLKVGDTGTNATMLITNAMTTNISGDVQLGVQAGSSGTLTVSGATSDGSAVTASTLKVSDDLIVGSAGNGTLIVNNGGAIVVDDGDKSLKIAESAGSTGVFAIGSASGDPALGTGSLSASSVKFGDGNGTVLFNHADESGGYEFSRSFEGTGTILTQSGTTVLSAKSSDFTGTTLVDGGTLSLSGSLPGEITVNDAGTLSVSGSASGDILVNSGGTLTGTGALTGTTTVNTGGTIVAGSPTDTLETADVTFEGGSVLGVEIDSDGNAGLIKSTGTIAIDGGTVAVEADSYFVDGTFTVAAADTAVNGTFSGATGSTAFITYTLSYDDTNVMLTQSVSQSFGSAALTENHFAVAAALESLPTDHPVVQSVFGAPTVHHARAHFDALSGEAQASLKGALMTTGRKVSDAVNRRLGGTFSGSAQTFAYGGTGSDQRHGAWIAGYGGWDDIDATANTAAADNDYGGIVAGIDREIGRNWRLGVFGAYGRTETTQSARSSSAAADSFSAGAYGGTTYGPIFFNIGGLATWHDIDSSRSVTVRSSGQTLTATYDASSWQVFSEAGYRFDSGDVRIEPFAGISFLQLDTDSYTEAGGSAALTAASDTESITFTTLGIRFGHKVSNRTRVYAMAGWQHAFGDVDPTSTFTLAGSIPFTVAGAPIALDALVLGLGFDVEMSNAVTLGARYDGRFGDGTTANQLEGWARLRF